jgi:exodeoxyribonuclease VII large subunit
MPSLSAIYSVTELTALIKQIIGGRFRDVRVEGEVSNAKLYPSGHLYFTLKDDNAMIRAVAFGYASKYFGSALLKDGDMVVCEGRVDVYEKRGEYQLIVSDLAVRRDEGLLLKKFLELKEKLFKEGLFDAARKRPLPLVPGRIGIVTSPAGAAIRDMLRIISSKFENMTVAIYPAKVQGDEAALEIAEGIAHFNQTKEVDVIIIGRGGGSLEDLAPFNEEFLARTIAASQIPVVSAVGHEVDFTIADFVADVRAPTPTAAADLVVPRKQELLDIIATLATDLEQAMRTRLERARFSLYEGAMELKDRRDFIVSHRMYVDELSVRLIHNLDRFFRDRKARLEGLSQRIVDLNPENILKRGYSITTKKTTGVVVSDAAQVVGGEELDVRLHKGSLDVSVSGIKGQV